ncbi:hypothetical protein Q3G72_026752 [Acer saccharum]|nr:hypothetical protein Q3G72_026752 [Acer saccharum]
MVHNLSDISSSIFLAEGFTEGEQKLQMVEYRESTPFFMIQYDSEALIYEHFDSLMIKEEEEELQQQELPCRVQYLGLKDCECPMKLEEALQSLSFLRGLSITESHKIISFQEASLPSQLRLIVIRNFQLPPNLKQLEIEHCSNLLTVLDEEEVSGSCNNTLCLEHLKIESCPSLTSLWSKSHRLPDTLRKIELSRCSNLATLASRGNLPKALRYLSITECSKLKLIAKGLHDNTKLEKLYIDDCEKLETLPMGINNLISLAKLAICNCPAMVSIPEGGFPTSLTSFEIVDTNICKSLFEWGLHRLTSLQLLGIGRCSDVMSFPQEETGMILPTSLTALGIFDFPNLERLSSIAQNLTCLEKLNLSQCPKLKYFPDDGLPKSLKQLEIKDCPLLEERCKEGEGPYWSIISHLSKEVSGYATSEEDD